MVSNFSLRLRLPLIWLLCISLGLLGHTAFVRAESPNKATPEAVWRAASRLGYAPTATLLQALQAHPQGPQGWALAMLEDTWQASQRPAQLSLINPPRGLEKDDLDNLSWNLPTLFKAAREERMARQAEKASDKANEQDRERFSRDMARQAAAWRVLTCSDPNLENPLLARLTEFWFNHLNVFVGKGAVRPFVGNYLLHAIRPNVLGPYEQMLRASAQHPAMLFYLDQAHSIGPESVGARMRPDNKPRGLNENYARELLELHTLGAQGGYTQNDVRELARILTGWTIDPQSESGFRFAPRLHDSGSKTLLGQTFPSNPNQLGQAEGEQALHLLAQHPATAQRIALRLAQFFVSDHPPARLVDKLARTYQQTQGDLYALMRALITSQEFWQSDATLFKTPFDFACSSLAVTGGVKSRQQLIQTLGFLSSAGQPVNGWQTPDGYKTDTATWLAPEALTRRADFAFAVGQGAGDLTYLQPFISATNWQRIQQESPAQRAGLILASPDFMNK